ncbi:hypothetical protein [Nocardia sp. NBC_00511]|uniref:hypothetical protein n=1 Tax=Nocardia sp. NBC_00511 TaxID=2903591 RepID=UPI0030E20A07
MAVIAFPTRDTTTALTVGAFFRRWRGRARLTDQERVNMRAARPRTAIYNASLGGHPYHW